MLPSGASGNLVIMNSHCNDQKVLLKKGIQLEYSVPKLKSEYMDVKYIHKPITNTTVF